MIRNLTVGIVTACATVTMCRAMPDPAPVETRTVETRTVAAPVPELHGDIKRATFTECAAEDSVTDCFYDSRHRGNHKGHGFYVVNVGRYTCDVYFSRKANRKLGTCYRKAS